jgi:hypothetical protein
MSGRVPATREPSGRCWLKPVLAVESVVGGCTSPQPRCFDLRRASASVSLDLESGHAVDIAIEEMGGVCKSDAGARVFRQRAPEYLRAIRHAHRLGSDASRIKRSEHIFPLADEVGALMAREGFEHVNVSTVTKKITFPSVVDYVRFQLVATPMARLLGDRNAVERESLIAAVASDTQSLLDPEMLRDGRLSFPQEAHVAIAHRKR